MNELAVVEKPRQQEKNRAPLRLEALGKGIGNINSGYSLCEVLTFIKGLHVKTSVWTSQFESTLEIVFPTPTFFKINRISEFDSTIYITGPLKKREPEFRAQGKRQVWRPTGFVALIVLINDKETGSYKVEEIILNTELSKRDLELRIKKAIGGIPQNWQFNPRWSSPSKEPQSKG